MGSLLLLALGMMALLWLYGRVNERYRTTARGLVQATRDVAGFNMSNEELSCAQRLELRAIPNRRLVRAFGINNSFTTMDTRRHREFLNQAGQAIQRMDGDAWERLFDVANRAMCRASAHEDDAVTTKIPLARRVRTITFIAILNVLFGVDPEDIAIDDVLTATELINKLWMQSKDSFEGQVSADDQRRLQTALHHMVPSREDADETQNNPLNIMMPAYETMWRVVLHTFVAAAFRTSDMETVRQLAKAVQNVPGCLGSAEEREVLALAKEGLRLYPPTKRIYRGPLSDSRLQEPWRADIERCHRDPAIWGRDALSFKPSRFLADLTGDQKRAYIPFSITPHACPAARGFGERAIILLVVVLVRNWGTRRDDRYIIFHDEKLDGDGDAVLPNGRDTAENWVLVINKDLNAPRWG